MKIMKMNKVRNFIESQERLIYLLRIHTITDLLRFVFFLKSLLLGFVNSILQSD
jgi:hypothetical protein